MAVALAQGKGHSRGCILPVCGCGTVIMLQPVAANHNSISWLMTLATWPPLQFFAAYMKLLQSSNYVTKRQSLKVALGLGGRKATGHVQLLTHGDTADAHTQHATGIPLLVCNLDLI